MPLLTDATMEEHRIDGSHYGFSAKRVSELGASEYTLGTIIVDVSGSVQHYARAIEDAFKEIVKACRHNPRADNMMLRSVTFDDKVEELHGFKPLTECNPDDYDGCVRSGGLTALYDAAYTGIKSSSLYGKNLTDQDFDVNAAVFVITDGHDNRSKMTRAMVKEALSEAIRSESLESITAVLIGLNTDPDLDQYLTSFKDEAGFTQYVGIADATEKELAKLGRFVSQSISSQSQALGTGGPSKSLSF